MTEPTDRDPAPSSGDGVLLSEAEIVSHLAHLPGWEVEDGHHLRRTFRFPDFAAGLAFVNDVGGVAEEAGHHPDIALSFGEVEVAVFTHAVDGLTVRDFDLAARIGRQYHPEPVPLQPIWRARDPAHAHLLAGLLAAAGIEAEVHGEDLFAGEGGILPSEAGPTVCVRAADAARAHELLTADADAATDDDSGDDSAEEGAA